jgi:excinuclease UvrABC ATPase subunit
MAEPVPASEARIEAATAAAVASEATSAEIAASIDNVAVERAQERVEEAEQAAADIALAAMHTKLGQDIEALSHRLSTWQNEHDQTHSMLTATIAKIETSLAALEAKMTTPPVEVIAEPLSSPPASPQATAVTVEPGSVEATPAESAVPAAPARKRMRLI